MTGEHITLNEILDDVKAYAAEPDTEMLKAILAAIATLDSVDREAAIAALVKHKQKHNLTRTMLRKEVKRLASEADSGSDPFFNENRFLPGRVCDALQASGHYLTLPPDTQLRVYQRGVYREDTLGETAKTIDAWLGDATRPERIKSVLELLKIRTTREVDRHTDYINLANGRFCLHSWQLLDHAPEYPSLIQLPVKLDTQARCPEFDNWLSEVLPAEDDQFLLLQLVGYSMLQDVRFGKLAVLYGPTHTGKSTCLEVVKALLGAENTSAISLHALDSEDRRFSRAGLVGKLANTSADLSSRYLAGDSQIKQIASGDTMQVEAKNGHPFSCEPFATLWASSNDLPVSHDRTDAWYERLILIPFMQQHRGESADRSLLDRLTQPSELSGILNRAIEALKVLLADNVFIQTQSTQQLLAAYKLANDHTDRFLSENYTRNTGTECLEEDVYNAYQGWCAEEGIKPLSKAKFRAGVITWGGKRKRKGSQERVWVFEGLQRH